MKETEDSILTSAFWVSSSPPSSCSMQAIGLGCVLVDLTHHLKYSLVRSHYSDVYQR